MIVVGLILVMAFAHATVRLCMYILRPPQYPISRTGSNATVAPQDPIPIVLRRDEEDFGDDEVNGVPKDAVLPEPPPAYGLWRGSTVSEARTAFQPYPDSSAADESKPHTLAKGRSFAEGSNATSEECSKCRADAGTQSSSELCNGRWCTLCDGR
jgi:hypothetical protein